MITEKEYLQALEIVNQFNEEEKQRNQVILTNMINDLNKYFKDHGSPDMQDFHLVHTNGANQVIIRFKGYWNEELDGSEPFLKELETIGNKYNKQLKVPYTYFWK